MCFFDAITFKPLEMMWFCFHMSGTCPARLQSQLRELSALESRVRGFVVAIFLRPGMSAAEL